MTAHPFDPKCDGCVQLAVIDEAVTKAVAAERERIATAIEDEVTSGWWHQNEDISAAWEGGIKAGLHEAARIARSTTDGGQ